MSYPKHVVPLFFKNCCTPVPVLVSMQHSSKQKCISNFWSFTSSNQCPTLITPSVYPLNNEIRTPWGSIWFKRKLPSLTSTLNFSSLLPLLTVRRMSNFADSSITCLTAAHLTRNHMYLYHCHCSKFQLLATATPIMTWTKY